MIDLQPGDIVLVLRPLKDPANVPVPVRLRAVLKHARRYCFLDPVHHESPDDVPLVATDEKHINAEGGRQ